MSTHVPQSGARHEPARATPRHTVARSGGKESRPKDQKLAKKYVKWIPVVVPLFAVLMAVLVYIIVGTLITR